MLPTIDTDAANGAKKGGYIKGEINADATNAAMQMLQMLQCRCYKCCNADATMQMLRMLQCRWLQIGIDRYRCGKWCNRDGYRGVNMDREVAIAAIQMNTDRERSIQMLQILQYKWLQIGRDLYRF
ncbi:hypothetical protein WA026_017946 [Henosepilachna vigintioctopunctata]|uniref:Uncharacterized protein n=1 Tax=Henosepilachna vigintioctopunctata TaxID=420089 RepID=A0AAW1TNW6_9CUCU